MQLHRPEIAFYRLVQRVLFVLIAVAGWAGIASAQPADRSDPKAAVKALFNAVEKGDSAAIRQVLFIEGDPNQELVGAYADLIIAGKRLGDAAKQKYPGAPNSLAQGTISPEDAAKIDTATVSVEGDKATMKISGRAEAVPLRKVNGQWRVSFGGGADNDAQSQSRKLALLTALTTAMVQSADEIGADKYPTVQAAEAAVKDRLDAVLAKALQTSPPTSKPATRQG